MSHTAKQNSAEKILHCKKQQLYLVIKSKYCVFFPLTIREWHWHTWLLFPPPLDPHCGPLYIYIYKIFILYSRYWIAGLPLSFKLTRNHSLCFQVPPGLWQESGCRPQWPPERGQTWLGAWWGTGPRTSTRGRPRQPHSTGPPSSVSWGGHGGGHLIICKQGSTVTGKINEKNKRNDVMLYICNHDCATARAGSSFIRVKNKTPYTAEALYIWLCLRCSFLWKKK